MNVSQWLLKGLIKALKGKIYIKLTANDGKHYYEYHNTSHCSISKKGVDADYSALTEKLNRVIKLLNLKLLIESRLRSRKISLANIAPKIGQEKYLPLILC